MTHYDKIRAALEVAREYMQESLNNERAAYKGHESISNIGEMNADIVRNRNALAALAELERAAKEPVAWRYRYSDGKHSSAWLTNNNPPPKEDAAVADVQLLYTTPPPAPVVEIREAVITDEVARKVFNAWIDARWRLNEGQDAKYGHAMINVVRAELGPALGLVEIREPTPEECADMAEWFKSECLACCINSQESADYGRAIFDAVKIVMWPKSEGS